MEGSAGVGLHTCLVDFLGPHMNLPTHVTVALETREALAGVMACHTLSCNETCMPKYHWFMCRMLFSVFSLKVTLQSCLEQTCTKPQQTCWLSTADGNLPIMWNCWKPTWALWKCEVCTNGMCFVLYPPVCWYDVYNLLKQTWSWVILCCL
jgi:hypothetical protein